MEIFFKLLKRKHKESRHRKWTGKLHEWEVCEKVAKLTSHLKYKLKYKLKLRNITLHASKWQKIVTQIIPSADKEAGQKKKKTHKHHINVIVNYFRYSGKQNVSI